MRMIRREKPASDDAALTRKLFLLLGGITFLMAIIVSSLTFFAPAMGGIFRLFSANKKDESPVIRPNPPIFSNIPEAVKESTMSINGFAQAGLTIKLFVNGPEVAQTTVASDGAFTFEKIDLMKGRNIIFAKAIDQNSVESDKSQTYSVNMDEKEPEITLDSPKDGDTVKNLDKRIEIKGKLNEKATIRINNFTAIQKPDLSFDFLLGATEGTMEIKIEATDMAGNKAEKKIKIRYVKSSN